MWGFAVLLTLASFLWLVVIGIGRAGRVPVIFSYEADRASNPIGFRVMFGLHVALAVATSVGCGHILWSGLSGTGQFVEGDFFDYREGAWPSAAFVLLMGAIVVAWVRRELRISRDARLRRQQRETVVQIADDVTTDPEGLNLDELVEFLDQDMIQEIIDALRAMPAGQRSLQRAIEKTGEER